MIDFDKAANFIWLNARLLDRHRFAHHFLGHAAEPVVATLRGYNNPDGGFGHALDPDLRTPHSGPVATQTALETLAEVGATDDPMIAAAADFLASIARDDGGIPFMLEAAEEHPHAEYFTYADESSLIQTSANAAALHALGVTHPWLDGATAWMWRSIDELDAGDDAGSGYGVRFTLAFLDAVPDAERADRAVEALAPTVAALVVEDPAQAKESRTPLDMSPWPNSRSRRLFEPALIERHLDALESNQQPDGGWEFDWPHWNPASAHEWRGAITVHALRLLKAHGRL
jgi:Prenyltransferase and squalene oxidase repeat